MKLLEQHALAGEAGIAHGQATCDLARGRRHHLVPQPAAGLGSVGPQLVESADGWIGARGSGIVAGDSADGGAELRELDPIGHKSGLGPKQRARLDDTLDRLEHTTGCLLEVICQDETLGECAAKQQHRRQHVQRGERRLTRLLIAPNTCSG